jgi:nucleotide-binding universal stress UspA family protein
MTIVVGFIRTDEGRAALDHAVGEARLRDARLVIVHSSEGGRHEDQEDVLAFREEFERIESRLTELGLDHELLELVQGHTPMEDILRVANETDAELIVIGLRRRSPVGKLILGSNAEEILLHADCPVLAVKPLSH